MRMHCECPVIRSIHNTIIVDEFVANINKAGKAEFKKYEADHAFANPSNSYWMNQQKKMPINI